MLPHPLLLRRTKPTGQDRKGQDRTGQERTGQDRTGQDRTGQDRTGQDRIGQGDGGVGAEGTSTIARMCNKQNEINGRAGMLPLKSIHYGGPRSSATVRMPRQGVTHCNTYDLIT